MRISYLTPPVCYAAMSARQRISINDLPDAVLSRIFAAAATRQSRTSGDANVKLHRA